MLKFLTRATSLGVAAFVIGIGPAADAAATSVTDPAGDFADYANDIVTVKVTNGPNKVWIRVSVADGSWLQDNAYAPGLADIDVDSRFSGPEYTLSETYRGDGIELRRLYGAEDLVNCKGDEVRVATGDLVLIVPRTCIAVDGRFSGDVRVRGLSYDRSAGADTTKFTPWVKPG